MEIGAFEKKVWLSTPTMHGDEAITELQKEHKHYSPAGISVKDNVVVIVLRDITEELKTRNEEFVAEHKKQFGYEPNLFDGV